MLDWSYNLLSQHEQAVLGRLSVFVGDFTLEAARSVASDAETDDGIVIDAIASLLVKSLISTTASHGSTYYRLLETTRTFAQAVEARRARGSESYCPASYGLFFQISPARPAHSIEISASTIFLDTPFISATCGWRSNGRSPTKGMSASAWSSLPGRRRYLSDCRCLRSASGGVNGHLLAWKIAPVAQDKKMSLQEALALSSMYITRKQRPGSRRD